MLSKGLKLLRKSSSWHKSSQPEFSRNVLNSPAVRHPPLFMLKCLTGVLILKLTAVFRAFSSTNGCRKVQGIYIP